MAGERRIVGTKNQRFHIAALASAIVVVHKSSNLVKFKTRQCYTLNSARFVLNNAGCRGKEAQWWIESIAEDNKTADV
jgi:hypothetical protein